MPYKVIKRIVDFILAIILILFFSPLLIVITILIWITDQGEICVKEPLRLGFKGKEFRMYKFRTMIPNAHDEILNNPSYAQMKEKWQKNGNKLKIEEDRRITKIGKLLRKTDLDELPQLFNVLKGEMSLVGPRPVYRDEVERFLEKNRKGAEYSNVEIKAFLKNIAEIRPGLTGIWQVSGRNEIPFPKRLEMDSEYVKNLNIFTDLKILLKTPFVILTRKGAYE